MNPDLFLLFNTRDQQKWLRTAGWRVPEIFRADWESGMIIQKSDLMGFLAGVVVSIVCGGCSSSISSYGVGANSSPEEIEFLRIPNYAAESAATTKKGEFDGNEFEGNEFGEKCQQVQNLSQMQD